MTTTTHHTGTERYLAYELVSAGEDARPTTASDVYALGCIGLEVGFNSFLSSESVILIDCAVHFFSSSLLQPQKLHPRYDICRYKSRYTSR